MRTQVQQERVQASAQTDRGEHTQTSPVRDEPQILTDHFDVLLVGTRNVTRGGDNCSKDHEHTQQDLVLQ